MCRSLLGRAGRPCPGLAVVFDLLCVNVRLPVARDAAFPCRGVGLYVANVLHNSCKPEKRLRLLILFNLCRRAVLAQVLAVCSSLMPLAV